MVLLIKKTLISPKPGAQLVFENRFEVVFLVIVLPVAIETITDIAGEELIRAFSSENCRNACAFCCRRKCQRRCVVGLFERTLTVIDSSRQSLFDLGPVKRCLVMNRRGMSGHHPLVFSLRKRFVVKVDCERVQLAIGIKTVNLPGDK